MRVELFRRDLRKSLRHPDRESSCITAGFDVSDVDVVVVAVAQEAPSDLMEMLFPRIYAFLLAYLPLSFFLPRALLTFSRESLRLSCAAFHASSLRSSHRYYTVV